jgi:hypothetical protein
MLYILNNLNGDDMIYSEFDMYNIDAVKSFRGKARKARGMRRTLRVRRNDEGCSATQHMDFLQCQKIPSRSVPHRLHLFSLRLTFITRKP